MIIRAFKEKNKNILNILTPFCLVATSICHVIYGLIYEESAFFIPNIFGIIIGCIYVGVWLYLKRLSREFISKKEDFEENKKGNNEDIKKDGKTKNNEERERIKEN